MAIADELIAVLGFDLKGQDNAQRYNSILDQTAKNAERVGKAIGGFIATGITTAYAGLTGLAYGVVNTGREFQKFEAILETIEGSADKAKESLDWVTEFAKRTPYDVAGVTDAFVKLKAYGIDPIANDALRVLGDTAAGMGKPLNAAVEMFADASGMEFERLKEFGLRASQAGDQVTFKWTKNGQELTKTMKKNGEEVRKFILETLGERFGGAMDKQSRTFDGILSNLGETWTQFQKKIGDKGFFDGLTGRLGSVLARVEELEDNGTLDRWAQTLSDNFAWASNSIFDFAERMAGHVAYIAENWEQLRAWVYGFMAWVAYAAARAFPVIAIMVALGLAVDDFLTYMRGGESIIGDFIEWIKELTGVGDIVAQSLAGLGAVVGTALAAAFFFAPVAVTKGFGMLLVNGIAAAGRLAVAAIWATVPLMGTAFSAALAALQPVIAAGMSAALFLLTNPVGWAILLGGAAAGLLYFFWEDIARGWNDLAGRATALFQSMRDWWAGIDLTDVGVRLMNSVWEGMKSIAQGIRDWFANLFSGVSITPPSIGGVPTPPAAGGSGAYVPPGAGTNSGMGGWDNWQRNMERAGAGQSIENTMNDSRQDNRQAPQTNNVTVNQTVQQATAAPAAAAQATGAAVAASVPSQRAQIESEPSF